MNSSKPVNGVSPHYQLRNPELSVLLYITCFQSKQRRYQGLCEQKQPINPVRSSHGESKVLAGSTVCLCTMASVCLISDVWTSNTTTCPSNGPQRLDRPRFRLFSRLLTKSKPKLPLGWPRFDLFSWDFHSPSNEPRQLDCVNDLHVPHFSILGKFITSSFPGCLSGDVWKSRWDHARPAGQVMNS